MRAVVLPEFGPAGGLVLTEVPDPVAGPGQALVDVEIANITFVETQVRAGNPPNPAMAPRLPVVLGNGVGGVVSSVGAGVDPALPGRRIVTTTGGSGGYAERVAVDAAGLIEVPAGLGLAEAVAVLADGRTALALIRAAAVRAGQVVLVEAAAGGVGSLLVQLARNVGARVVAAAGGPRKVALAEGLGASLAADYTDPRWVGRVRALIGGVDAVFDGVGGTIGRAAFDLVRDGGRFCAYGLASGAFTQIPVDEASRRGVTVVRGAALSPAEMGELTRAAIAETAAGWLRPVIGQTFPLARAADAHAAIEARATVGKTLLLVSGQAGSDR
ncbi:MAG TPA: zinc-binding dehydrogenase [Mycobacteriales bacterium]|nr:zinc-binding dehydrogenase [Mycobacteriales bacterium]